MYIYLSLLICLIGLYLFSTSAEPRKETGRLMFFAGLLAFLLQIQNAHFFGIVSR